MILSFFPIRDRLRRFPSFHISVALAQIVKPLITELSHIRKLKELMELRSYDVCLAA